MSACQILNMKQIMTDSFQKSLCLLSLSKDSLIALKKVLKIILKCTKMKII